MGKNYWFWSIRQFPAARLGYEDSVKEISERCGIDVSIVKKIENDLMNELQKKGENYEN